MNQNKQPLSIEDQKHVHSTFLMTVWFFFQIWIFWIFVNLFESRIFTSEEFVSFQFLCF